MRPISSHQVAKMKSLCGLGQVQLLLHAVAEAAAEQSARADGDLTHGGLKAGVAHIRERVEPDIHAVAYMLERQIRGERAESGEDACRNEEPDAQTGGDQHDETDAAGDDDRGVMRLLREQENIDREQRAVWVEQLFQCCTSRYFVDAHAAKQMMTASFASSDG